MAHFNLIMTVGGTAFVAGLIASAGAALNFSATPDDALASSVLLLVPGVPLINAAEDLIKGHMVTGIVRGLTGVLISLGIALGLLLAMRLMGVGRLDRGDPARWLLVRRGRAGLRHALQRAAPDAAGLCDRWGGGARGPHAAAGRRRDIAGRRDAGGRHLRRLSQLLFRPALAHPGHHLQPSAA